MNMHRAVATNALWGKLDQDPRASNAIILAAILARLVSDRPTPREVGIVQVSLDLFHAWARVGALNNSCPLEGSCGQR